MFCASPKHVNGYYFYTDCRSPLTSIVKCTFFKSRKLILLMWEKKTPVNADRLLYCPSKSGLFYNGYSF